MATNIERIVEPVIEDPVVDIFAEPDTGSGAAGLVPALNLGPVGRGGHPHRSGNAVLPEERFSEASDPGNRATDTGRDTLPEPGNFSFPPRSDSIGEAGSGPQGLTSSRPVPPASSWISPSNGGTENGEGVAPDASPDSEADTPPDEVPDESAQPDTAAGATIFGTEGDDLIEMQFVFPAEIRTAPGIPNGTTPKADVVTGNGGDDTVNGGGGDDVIDGGSGDDVLSGGSGDDVLSGGDGNDELTGGTGTDQLIGGSGADRFVFDDVAESPAQAPDLVFDFNAVQGDRIDVSGIDAISDTTEIDEFIFVSDDAFSGSAGELRFVQDGSDGLLEGDVNGDGMADFSIELLGVTSLSGDDIMGLG